MGAAGKLKAPIVHAMRGKEFIAYDNPFDVGMTGLLGFSSGYQAMMDADTLLMLGTDLPYQQFYPENATADGIFHMTGPQSKPSAGQVPVRIAHVTDGTSGTLLFGERSPVDGNWDSFLNAPFTQPPVPPLRGAGACGVWSAFGQYAIGDVTLSAWTTINYTQPYPYNPPPQPPPRLRTTAWKHSTR